MTWILIVYLVALLLLAYKHEKIVNLHAFRVSWVFFTLVLGCHFLFTLFRAGNFRDPREMMLVEIWATGLPWLFFSISFFALMFALLPFSQSPRIPESSSNQP
jgi:hypothetical protein